MIVDLPYKITNSIFINSTCYFIADLRREPGRFFFFLLTVFTMGLSMSIFFRLVASMTKTIAQALAPSSLILLLLSLYIGFIIPVHYMRECVHLHVCSKQLTKMNSWASWLRRINPIAYGFENAMVNEFHGRSFGCTYFVPSGSAYKNITAENRACAVQDSVPGSNFVTGTSYVETAFSYKYSHRWSNYGVILAITILLFFAHLIMSEVVASERSKGEVLVFRRSNMRKTSTPHAADEESDIDTVHQSEKFSDSNELQQTQIQKQVSVFHWEGVNYDVPIKGGHRTILDSVDGWIKPGTLTALMVRLVVMVVRDSF